MHTAFTLKAAATCVINASPRSENKRKAYRLDYRAEIRGIRDQCVADSHQPYCIGTPIQLQIAVYAHCSHMLTMMQRPISLSIGSVVGASCAHVIAS